MDKQNKTTNFFKKLTNSEASINRLSAIFIVTCILLVVLIVKLDKTNNYLQTIADNGNTKLEIETQDDTFIEIITEKDKTKEDYIPQLEIITDESNKTTNPKVESTTNVNTTTTQANDDNVARKIYVLNTSSKKIHSPSCSFVERTKEENRKVIKLSTAELNSYINDGFEICKTCGGEYNED